MSLKRVDSQSMFLYVFWFKYKDAYPFHRTSQYIHLYTDMWSDLCNPCKRQLTDMGWTHIRLYLSKKIYSNNNNQEFFTSLAGDAEISTTLIKYSVSDKVKIVCHLGAIYAYVD